MRAQIALEFIVIMSLAVVMLVTFLWVGAYQLNEGASEARQARVSDIAETIQQELATAISVRDGYRREFMLPYTIENDVYTISGVNDTEVQVITVSFRNKVHSVRAPLCAGSLAPGPNVVRKVNDELWCNS